MSKLAMDEVPEPGDLERLLGFLGLQPTVLTEDEFERFAVQEYADSVKVRNRVHYPMTTPTVNAWTKVFLARRSKAVTIALAWRARELGFDNQVARWLGLHGRLPGSDVNATPAFWDIYNSVRRWEEVWSMKPPE